MNLRQSRTCDALAAVLLIVASIFRLWYGATHELISDEAYYWQWSRHLDYGYYDNTPLLAYVIRFFVAILGPTQLGVRAGAVACVFVMSLLVYLLARRMFGAQMALLSLVTLNLIPLAADASFLMTQDPVQLMFWAAAVYAAWLAVEPDRVSDTMPLTRPAGRSMAARNALWVLAGVLSGLTIMAKLNGILILPAIFLYLCLSPNGKAWLKRPAPYVAAVIALLIFVPFLVWNHTHLNAYWLHGKQMGTRNQDKAFYPILDILDLLGTQAIVLSPLLYLTYLRLVGRPFAYASTKLADSWLFLWCCSVSVTAGTALVALHNKIEGNWAVDAYVTGIIMVALAIATSWNRPKTRAWHIASLVLAGLLSTAPFVLRDAAIALHLKMGHKIDRGTEMVGWKQLARKVESEQAVLGGPSKAFVFSVSYRLPSQMAFYLPGHPVTYSLALHARANNYMFWEDPNKRLGDNGVFINDTDSDEGLAECRAIFDRVERQPLYEIHETPYKEPIRVVSIYRCYGFKGYDRAKWQEDW